MPRHARLAALVLLCLTALLAGCGGGPAAGGEGPASAVPRDAAVYLEATVRPSGSLRDDALAAAGKVLRTPDPAARIDELVADLLADSEGPELDYARDVEPWLGETVGVWLAAGSDDEPRGAAVLSATDTEAARAAIERAVQRSGERFSERSYEGADYLVDADGGAAGVVEDFVVLGSEAELKRTVDTLGGSEALVSDDRYEDALAELEDERLGHFFFDTKALMDQALRADPSAGARLRQLRSVLPLDRLGPVAGAFTADGERLAVDSVTSAAGGELLSRFGALTGAGSTPLLGELPGDSWAALGSPKLGDTAKRLYQQFAGAFGGAAIAEQLRSQLGIDLERDVFSWIGDVAFFARGTTPETVDGGAVIEVVDEERARSAFGKLIGLLQTRAGASARPISVPGAETAFELRPAGGRPVPVVAARSADRVVIAYGADAAAAALSRSGERLGDGPTYSAAKTLLGEGYEPGFLLSMPAVLELVAAAGGDDPHVETVRRHLEAFTVVASGGKVEDDRARYRVAAGLE